MEDNQTVNDHFYLNGYLWRISYVSPESNLLVDRTGSRTVATTDPVTRRIYISNALQGDFLIRVIIHELGHAALESFFLLDDIHTMVRSEYWIQAEEDICNFIADYGSYIFNKAKQILGISAINIIPREIERRFK